MRISDEERRNVAANMRSAAERCKYDLQDDPDYDPFAALYCVFCGVRRFPRYKDILHLADLIDRPTCRLELTAVETYGNTEVKIYECSECGRTCEEIYGKYERCPHCGAVVLDGTAH